MFVSLSWFRVVILQDQLHSRPGPSLEALKFADTKKNQIHSSKAKEKRVSYLEMETLKRIVFQFMEMLVWIP
jgi:hypothetical protein